jgi:hypothetical protein
MSPRTPAGLAPQQLLHALWKQRTCWILLWLLATAVVLAAVWSLPWKFKSEAILAVEPLRQPGRSSAVPSDAELRAQLQLARLRVLRRDRLLEILRKSWPELVARWRPSEAPREVERLRDRITIATLPESRGRFSAVRVSFESRDPARGAAVVNRLAIELAQEFDRLTPPPAADSTRQQRQAAWARLAECQQTLNDFDSEHGPDLQLREQSLLKAIGTLQADLLANERMLEQTAAARATPGGERWKAGRLSAVGTRTIPPASLRRKNRRPCGSFANGWPCSVPATPIPTRTCAGPSRNWLVRWPWNCHRARPLPTTGQDPRVEPRTAASNEPARNWIPLRADSGSFSRNASGWSPDSKSYSNS